MKDRGAGTGGTRGRAGSRVAGNSIWNLLAFATGVAVNLVTIPIVVARIGMHDFGVAGLVIATVAPFLLVGTVLGQATAQDVALHAGRADLHSARHGTAAVFALLALCVPAGIMLLAGLAPTIARALFTGGGPVPASELRTAFAIAALGWAAQQVNAVLQGVHVGQEAYRRIATVNAASAIVAGALIVVIVDRAPSAIGYLTALAAGYWAMLLLWLASAWRDARWCFTAPRFERAPMHAVLSFSGWQMAAQLTATIATQADRYLLGLYVRPQTVGFYNVAQRLEEVAYIGVLKGGEVLFPFFSSTADEEPARMADRYLRASWLLNLFAAMVLAPLVPWAQDILRLWIDATTAEKSAHVLRILAVAGLVGCASNVFGFFAMGTGRTRSLALLSAAIALASITVSIALLPHFGLAAAGVGALAGMATKFAVVTALMRRIFGEHAPAVRLIHSTVLPATAGLATAAAVSLAPLAPAPGWPGLIARLALTACLVGAVVVGIAASTRTGRHSLVDLRRVAQQIARRKPSGVHGREHG